MLLADAHGMGWPVQTSLRLQSSGCVKIEFAFLAFSNVCVAGNGVGLEAGQMPVVADLFYLNIFVLIHYFQVECSLLSEIRHFFWNSVLFPVETVTVSPKTVTVLPESVTVLAETVTVWAKTGNWWMVRGRAESAFFPVSGEAVSTSTETVTILVETVTVSTKTVTVWAGKSRVFCMKAYCRNQNFQNFRIFRIPVRRVHLEFCKFYNSVNSDSNSK